MHPNGSYHIRGIAGQGRGDEMLEARHIPTVPSLEAGSSLGILMSHLGIMCMWKIKEKEEKKKRTKTA